MILGDSDDPENVFRWETVQLNLPGDPDYNPALAWVRKIRSDGYLAADIHDYVDDYGETAPGEEEGWKAASKVEKDIVFMAAMMRCDAMRCGSAVRPH